MTHARCLWLVAIGLGVVLGFSYAASWAPGVSLSLPYIPLCVLGAIAYERRDQRARRSE